MDETNNTEKTASAPAKPSAPAVLADPSAAATAINTKLVVIIVSVCAAVAASAIAIAVVLTGRGGDAGNGGLTLGYANNAVVVLDERSLQQMMDEAMRNAQDRRVALQYQNDAYSTDGRDFRCHIVNSGGNLYDMFLTIFTDAELTDQVFLSQLLRPGTGFENIQLSRALKKGVTTVYVAVTLVDTEEDGTQVIKSQVIHTMDFHVSG